MPIPAVRLVNGHPDDQNAEASALAAFQAPEPPYQNEWPRETAFRYLNALSSGDPSRTRVATPPSEKDLAAFLRMPARSLIGLALFDVALGADRVASEITAFFERGSNDASGMLLDVLGELRERLSLSDRSRLDARLRILGHTSRQPKIEAMLQPKRTSKRPPKPVSVPPAPPKKSVPPAPPAKSAPPPAPKKPAKKKAPKKK